MAHLRHLDLVAMEAEEARFLKASAEEVESHRMVVEEVEAGLLKNLEVEVWVGLL